MFLMSVFTNIQHTTIIVKKYRYLHFRGLLCMHRQISEFLSQKNLYKHFFIPC